MTDSKPDLVIALVAGGQSRRMGTDKTMLTINGEPLISRVCAAASATGLPVCIIGRDPQSLPPDLSGKYPAFPDIHPGRGPLAGLVTAFHHYPQSAILLSATDLPQITTPCYQWLINQTVTAQPGTVIVPLFHDRLQPLFAIYPPSIRPHAEHAITSPTTSMLGLISNWEKTTPLLQHQYQGSINDIDTPKDLHNLTHP